MQIFVELLMDGYCLQAYSLQSIESIEMFIEGMPCQLKMQQTQAKQLVKIANHAEPFGFPVGEAS